MARRAVQRHRPAGGFTGWPPRRPHQCSLEEATELKLGMLGHTAMPKPFRYTVRNRCLPMAMTLHGRKASSPPPTPRGLKCALPPVPVLEVQMGYAEGKSMLYLEARCIYITKAAGVQGLQNGSPSAVSACRPPCRPGSAPYWRKT